MDVANGADNASRCPMPLCAESHVTKNSSERIRAMMPAKKVRKILAFARDRWATAQMSLKQASGPFADLHMIRARFVMTVSDASGSIGREAAPRFEPALICPCQFL